jgi:hypothetical protein
MLCPALRRMKRVIRNTFLVLGYLIASGTLVDQSRDDLVRSVVSPRSETFVIRLVSKSARRTRRPENYRTTDRSGDIGFHQVARRWVESRICRRGHR